MRPRPAVLLLSLLASTVAFAADKAATQNPARDVLQPMDVFSLQWADHPTLSPDGRTIVYERSFFDVMKDTRRANLWLIDVASGDERPLTTGATRDGQATWSPDGKRIAYVAADGDKPQVFVRWVDGGQTARITQLTSAPANLEWSPDGKWIAFTMHVPATPDSFAQLPKAPEGAQWAAPPKVIDKLVYRFDGGGYREPGYSHLFIVPAHGGAVRQVTHGDHDFDGRAVWLNDSRSVIVSGNLGEGDPDENPLESDLYRIDIRDGAITRLTDRIGPDNAPALSADGKRVAYVGFDDQRMGYHNAHLYVLDLASGKSRVLTPDFDNSIEDPQWDGDRGIWFSYDARGVSRIAWIAANGGKIEEISQEYGGTAMGRPYGGGSMSSAAGRVAFTRGTAYTPADVAVVQRGGKARVLTDLGAGLLDGRTLGKIEEVTYKSSADQREVQGWIAYPPHFDKSKKYPLLLEIHGGPFENYGPRFAPETQLYAAHGYVVLYLNPRGSTSYGADFANQIHHNYPSQDYDDLMSGVDTLVARGFIDEKNLFVTGGSGGGVLTAWIVGHTDRFRAAVVAKPVINWASFVLTSDFTPFFNRYWFAAPPWEDPAPYIKRSPITYVGNVKTPTMLISGENDYRTPISEAEQFYQALRLRKVPTALVRIPGASHSINARPSQMIAQVLYTIGWCEKHRAK
jgi:dipeptidyl aminopeptidase/acylaminoacyl peptidase